MQVVISGLLYDTNTAIMVHKEESTRRILYCTPNRNFFTFYLTGEIVPKTEESTKDYLGKHNIPKYIEYFGEPQEA